jgi:putative MATE family efflux protein
VSSPATASVSRRLFSLAWPIIGLNVLNVLALAVDTAMVGRLGDSDLALTALGFATQVVFLLLVAMIGLSVGTVAVISRAHGARDPERVANALAQSSTLTALLGIAVGIVGNLLAPLMLSALGASDEVVDVGLEYLRPLLAGTVFYYLTILYGSALRGVGNTRLAFSVALVSNVVNFCANYCLILGNFGFPALGLQGAAYGTVFSQMVSVALLVYILSSGTVEHLRLSLRPRPFDRPLIRRLLRIGAPAAADMVILNAGFVMIIGMLGRIDEIAVAAHGVGLRIQALAFIPGLSVSQATGAMVGQALGRGDPDEARGVARASIVLCTVIMSTLAIAIVIAAPMIVGVFDVDPSSELGEYAIEWMRILGYGMPIVGVHIALVGLLQGAGATKTSLRINLIGTILFQIPLGVILGFWVGWGVFGVWISFPMSFVIKAALSSIAYKRGNWAKVGLEA